MINISPVAAVVQGMDAVMSQHGQRTAVQCCEGRAGIGLRRALS